MGFTAAKMDIDDALDPARLDRVNWTASNGEIDHMVAKVAFTRQLYPKHFDLAVVMHGRYDAGTGKRVNVKEATAGLTRAGVASSVVPFTELQSRDGVDIVTVKELLGHANISTTMRYAHSNDDAKRRAVNRLRSDKIVTMPPQRAKKAV